VRDRALIALTVYSFVRIGAVRAEPTYMPIVGTNAYLSSGVTLFNAVLGHMRNRAAGHRLGDTHEFD
jgi:hypothetical protein